MHRGVAHMVGYPLPREGSGGPAPFAGSNIWGWPLKLKHGRFPSGQYASYWNAFFFISVFKLINFSCQYHLYWVSRCGQLWIHTVELVMTSGSTILDQNDGVINLYCC